MSSDQIKLKRLSQRCGLFSYVHAVRVLGYDCKVESNGFRFGFLKDAPGSLTGQLYYDVFVLDENISDWLNSQLEDHHLLDLCNDL